MTNEIKARQLANYFAGETDNESAACAYHAAIAMAQWKDELHKQEKQQWIDKACEFWEHKFPYIGVDTIEEFVDTMKGE